MVKKYIFSCLQFFILALFCSSFLKGQENLILNPPFQNCWELSERITNKIASDNETKIFMPISSGSIKTININKTEIWNIDLGGEIVSQPIYQDETLYVLSKVNKSVSLSPENIEEQENIRYFVSAINTESGITRWRKEYESKLIPILFLQKGKLIIVSNKNPNRSSENTSNFVVLDKYTGNIILEKTYDFGIKQYYDISDENIVMLTSINSIVSFSILDGEIVFFSNPIENIQIGLAYRKRIILSDDKGFLYFADSEGKEIKLKIRFGAKVTGISFYDDRFLISSLDNFIYSVSLDGKKINWKKRLPGRIVEKPIISQNIVIASSQGDNSLYFINFDDGKVFNRITVPDGQEIIGSPIPLGNFVVVTTNKGIRAYSSNNCKNLTAADR